VEVDAFIARGRRLSLGAGAAFVEPGESRHRLEFIHEGMLRYHLLIGNGEDVTKDFGFPGWFMASFGSAVRGIPARVAISTVSPCRLTVWPFHTLAELMDTPGEWQRFGRCVAEMLYARKEEREISLLTDDATERYKAPNKMFPSAVRLIPHYHLAPYLGVSQQSLSRIRTNYWMKEHNVLYVALNIGGVRAGFAASLSEWSDDRINRCARAWTARSLEKALAFRSKPSIGVDVEGCMTSPTRP
jgi:hypothetical protein